MLFHSCMYEQNRYQFELSHRLSSNGGLSIAIIHVRQVLVSYFRLGMDSFWKVIVSFHCRLQFQEHRRLLFAIARKQQWGTKRRSENRQYPEERTAVTRVTERKSKKRRQPARRVEKLSFATTKKRAFSFWARIHVWTSRPPTRRRRRRPRRQKVTRK